jgi:hypothetical protein
LKDNWFRLLKEEWINPALLDKRNIDRSFALLDKAKTFHEKLNEYFRPNSYAIYWADTPYEGIEIGLRLHDHPDVHFSITIMKNRDFLQKSDLAKDIANGQKEAVEKEPGAWTSHLKVLRLRKREMTLDTRVKGNMSTAQKPSLSDEEALTRWDSLLNSIRVRPHAMAPSATATANQSAPPPKSSPTEE